MFRKSAWAAFLVALSVFPAPAQIQPDQKCPVPIYDVGEVAKPAKILARPDFSIINKAGANARGQIVLEAVLCRTGRVTDIRIIEGSSSKINKFAVAVVSEVRFAPAELRWHTVSERRRFEIQLGPNEPGMKVTTSAEAVGRLVENVDVVGNRRLTSKEILSWIKTRPGERYDSEQIKKDFDAVLATGYFDKLYTRVYIEEGVRGGIGVIFEVVELPLIAEVEFEGLKIDQSLIFEAMKKEGIFLKVGTPYDAVPVQHAVRIIKQVLSSSGRGDYRVEARSEQVSATSVKVTFVIISNQ